MDEKEQLIKVGKYNLDFNALLGIEIDELDIYRSKGLPSHMVKRKHYKCLKYIDYIPDILIDPDYIGINPNEDGDTIELIKVLDKNILVGVKLDIDENYLYVSTMHEIQESKLQRRIHGGRIKKFDIDIDKDK